MKLQPEQIAHLRARLAAEHARQPQAGSAFDLGRLAYVTGDYDEAIRRFAEARDRAPDDPACVLSLVRAASGLGLHGIEEEALARASRECPPSPDLALHRALRDVPDRIDDALHLLRQFDLDPGCREFAVALERIVGGLPVNPVDPGNPRTVARAASVAWVQRHTADPRVFRGLPVTVLEHADDIADVEGLVLEFGVYFGRSLRVLAARNPMVHGFDSFEGLPEAWNEAEGAGAYSTLGQRPRVTNTELHVGWFEDSLPGFLERHPGPVRLLHVDCDLYSSTRTVLHGLRGRIVPGTVIVFDDLLGYPGYEAHEVRALEEFVAATGMRYEVVAAALLGREVAIRVTR